MTGQAVRYLLVGVSNTAITLAAYVLLLGAGVPAIGSSVLAFAAGAVNGLGVALAVQVVDLPKIAGEIVALPLVTATTFLLARSWVFAARNGRGGPAPAVPRPR